MDKKIFLKIRVRNRRHPYGITIYEKIRSGGAEVRIVSTNLVNCMHTIEDFIERREKKKKVQPSQNRMYPTDVHFRQTMNINDT